MKELITQIKETANRLNNEIDKNNGRINGEIAGNIIDFLSELENLKG